MNVVKYNLMSLFQTILKWQQQSTFDFAFASFLVEALDVAIFADVERRVNEDFQERESGVFVYLPSPVSILCQ